jgi:hypothetical protein
MTLVIDSIAYAMVVLAIYLIADGMKQAIIQIWKNLKTTGKNNDKNKKEKFNPPI